MSKYDFKIFGGKGSGHHGHGGLEDVHGGSKPGKGVVGPNRTPKQKVRKITDDIESMLPGKKGKRITRKIGDVLERLMDVGKGANIVPPKRLPDEELRRIKEEVEKVIPERKKEVLGQIVTSIERVLRGGRMY